MNAHDVYIEDWYTQREDACPHLVLIVKVKDFDTRYECFSPYVCKINDQCWCPIKKANKE